jgi:hypothetical protein
MTKNQIEATAAYKAKKQEAEALMKAISAGIKAQGKGDVNWADVGSLSQVITLLKEVDQFVNGTDHQL